MTSQFEIVRLRRWRSIWLDVDDAAIFSFATRRWRWRRRRRSDVCFVVLVGVVAVEARVVPLTDDVVDRKAGTSWWLFGSCCCHRHHSRWYLLRLLLQLLLLLLLMVMLLLTDKICRNCSHRRRRNLRRNNLPTSKVWRGKKLRRKLTSDRSMSKGAKVRSTLRIALAKHERWRWNKIWRGLVLVLVLAGRKGRCLHALLERVLG